MASKHWYCLWLDAGCNFARVWHTECTEANPEPTPEQIEKWMTPLQEDKVYCGVLVRADADGSNEETKPIGSWKKRKPTFIVRKVADPM